MDLFHWLIVLQKTRQCWLCKNLSSLLELLSLGKNAVYAKCSVGLYWVYLTRDPDLLSLCNTHKPELWNPLKRNPMASRFYALVFMLYQASSGSYCSAEQSEFLESLLALLKCGALRDQLRSGVWMSALLLQFGVSGGVRWRGTPTSGWSYENWFHYCSWYLHHSCFSAVFVSFHQIMRIHHNYFWLEYCH